MSEQLFDLSGKRALVTGSSRGLGFDMARGLGEAGATLFINGTNQQRIDKAVSELKNAGLDAYGALFDVTKTDQIEQCVTRIEETYGPIDILINNAGIISRGLILDMDEKDWDSIIEVNLSGVFRVSKRVARGMVARKSGKIININSMMSELGRPNVAAYAASKGGVKMLTKNMAAEWGPCNVQTNGIGPGYFNTELTKPLQQDEKFDTFIRQRTPAGRWGEPAELVGPAVFLSSRASDFVNGHILYVDGGILAVL